MSRAEVLARLPIVFGLQEEEAAASVGFGATKFREMVAAGAMPKPRLHGGRKVYDVDELRAAFKALPKDGGEEIDTWAGVG